jgi:hypothetical protein
MWLTITGAPLRTIRGIAVTIDVAPAARARPVDAR